MYVVPGGVWFDHVLSWWKHRDDPNILFLTYEDRIKVRKWIEASINNDFLKHKQANIEVNSRRFGILYSLNSLVLVLVKSETYE